MQAMRPATVQRRAIVPSSMTRPRRSGVSRGARSTRVLCGVVTPTPLRRSMSCWSSCTTRCTTASESCGCRQAGTEISGRAGARSPGRRWIPAAVPCERAASGPQMRPIATACSHFDGARPAIGVHPWPDDPEGSVESHEVQHPARQSTLAELGPGNHASLGLGEAQDQLPALAGGSVYRVRLHGSSQNAMELVRRAWWLAGPG